VQRSNGTKCARCAYGNARAQTAYVCANAQNRSLRVAKRCQTCTTKTQTFKRKNARHVVAASVNHAQRWQRVRRARKRRCKMRMAGAFRGNATRVRDVDVAAAQMRARGVYAQCQFIIHYHFTFHSSLIHYRLFHYHSFIHHYFFIYHYHFSFHHYSLFIHFSLFLSR